jgi:shikimate dehydrogenase
MNITSSTKLYCIIGKPVSQSLSPVMHNRAFQFTGTNAVYCAFEPSGIGEAVAAMRALNIAGASVTIPFKIDVMDYIDEVDPIAAKTGSVNTLVNRNGKITGYNTDGTGARAALEKAGARLSGSSVLLIGNGGSARGIAYALLSAGAHISVTGRNPERISAFAESLKDEERNISVGVKASGELTADYASAFDIIINTTPLGMEPQTNATPIGAEFLRKGQYVFDIVYKPDMTRLLTEAEKKGCIPVKGVEMLIHQGARQFEIWTGKAAPVDEMRRIVFEFLYGR